jgi:hypothetical protein
MKLTNEKLYDLCKKYGSQARLWRQKFIGLLPEVNRRRLYEEKGFSSIFEFAFKLCGLSGEQVRLALNLERRFEDKPILKKMFENGEASINKLTRIVSIATPENEEELAEKIKVLPISALNTFVRDERKENTNANGSRKPLFEEKDLYVQTLHFEIDTDITEELNELHSKGIDVNELLREMLRKRKQEIAKAKEEISKTIESTESRYIPVRIKKIIQEEYGEKCSIATCQKPSTETHHTQRLSLSLNHNPKFLAPLCRDHHIIAHSIDVQYHRARKFAVG